MFYLPDKKKVFDWDLISVYSNLPGKDRDSLYDIYDAAF